VVPGLPHKGALGDVMLLIIAIVGTTVAPWQLFFSRAMSSTSASPRACAMKALIWCWASCWCWWAA
jgi:Mn2+/Fe2+ NRAMP family transporter